VAGEEQPDYLVRLRPRGAGAPAALRLRRYLKLALRGFGLQCAGLRELPRDGKEYPGRPQADHGEEGVTGLG
jgi:hypothetical protein